MESADLLSRFRNNDFSVKVSKENIEKIVSAIRLMPENDADDFWVQLFDVRRGMQSSLIVNA
jgi:hypothetical protein